MPVTRFPDPSDAGPDGILAIGGDLHPESLLLAYRSGIFPWPVEGLGLAWFCPEKRGILRFDQLHLPRSLKRAAKQAPYTFTFDTAFSEVIRSCAAVPRPGQRGTWITTGILRAYQTFHHLGYAHSVEAWEGETLVGGVYGVAIDGAFAGESMFHLRPNASKLALLHLFSHLRSRGLEWVDIQMVTPHMEALGAEEINREEFLRLLAETRAQGLKLFSK